MSVCKVLSFTSPPLYTQECRVGTYKYMGRFRRDKNTITGITRSRTK